jgi:hypothetical protein
MQVAEAVTSEVNARRVAELVEVLRELHQQTLHHGFHGKVVVEWHVKDGTIQGEVQPTVHQCRRLK